MYYGAILIDLMLRCTWSFKLSPHLDHFNDLEGSIFIMEFLEILRRMWSNLFYLCGLLIIYNRLVVDLLQSGNSE